MTWLVIFGVSLPVLLFFLVWSILLWIIDPIGRQFPDRTHPPFVPEPAKAQEADTESQLIALLKAEQTLSAIELYMRVFGCSFVDAQIKVLKIEAELASAPWD